MKYEIAVIVRSRFRDINLFVMDILRTAWGYDIFLKFVDCEYLKDKEGKSLGKILFFKVKTDKDISVLKNLRGAYEIYIKMEGDENGKGKN